ncbi:MAG: hypothetical protein GY753_07010 [Gammaproteobacteria bacterium]|nr:hypothetical protein [Gammaproteobacteria bacterium]
MGNTEIVNFPTEETGPESPEQIAADAAAPEQTEERPAWLPEKFENAEAMAKSYKELESAQGGKPPTEDPKPGDLEIPEAAAAAGVTPEDMQFYSDRFAETGKLEDSDYEGLREKHGISREMVDTYVAGQLALGAQYEQGIYAQVGGREAYTAMTAWAAENVDQSEVALFNEAMNSGDPAKANSAVNGMKARYQLENGKAPELMQGSTSGSGTSSYQSLAQMKAEMRDPRYAADPAFRKSVTDKLANSNIM